ncbi:MAG TPA: hypothetical protein VEC36_14020 [Patescibacteria group bacterium]|nr:hypothetical protein [Patescibacteria group bacterium]
MKRILWVIAGWMMMATPALFAQDIQATTSKGDRVLLHSNGTWSAIQPGSVPRGGSFSKPKASKASLKGKKVKYTLWYNKAEWSLQLENSNDDAEYQLAHSSGEAFALVIPESIELTMDEFREAAIQNARNAAHDAQIVFEEERTVNGNPVRCIRINGTVEEIPVSYFSYYYIDKKSSVQVITYVTQNQFEQYEEAMANLLNGFEPGK